LDAAARRRSTRAGGPRRLGLGASTAAARARAGEALTAAVGRGGRGLTSAARARWRVVGGGGTGRVGGGGAGLSGDKIWGWAWPRGGDNPRLCRQPANGKDGR